jgi:hypothetical protein
MSTNEVLWLAVIASAIHVLVGALQAGSFNSFLAVLSLPPINVKVFPWLGLAAGLGGGVVDGLQHGMAVSPALATALGSMFLGGASALHVETMRGALPANTPGAAGSLQVVAVQAPAGSPPAPPVAIAKRLALVLASLACLLLFVAHCGGASSVTAEGAYGTGNTACVLFATSRSQSEACVSTEQAVWCGDGGLQTNVANGVCSSLDGGK